MTELQITISPLDEEAQKRIKAVRATVLTTARDKRGDVHMEIGQSGGYQLRTTSIPLDHYLKLRTLNTEEYRAGNRLFSDFYFSGQTSKLTVNLNAMPQGERGAYLPNNERQREARENYRKALMAVHGKIGQLMVNNVCCFGFWVNDFESPPYNQRSAIHRFKEALADLVEFYKSH